MFSLKTTHILMWMTQNRQTKCTTQWPVNGRNTRYEMFCVANRSNSCFGSCYYGHLTSWRSLSFNDYAHYELILTTSLMIVIIRMLFAHFSCICGKDATRCTLWLHISQVSFRRLKMKLIKKKIKITKAMQRGQSWSRKLLSEVYAH